VVEPQPRAKRRYDNTLRQAQARATKALVIDAATELFVDKGYAATSIEGIAELSGVPIATVYRLLGSKATMLREVLGTAVADEPTFEIGPDEAAGSGEELLAAAARFTRELHTTNGHLYHVLRSAASSDAEAGAVLAEADARRLGAHTTLGRTLAEQGALADDVTATAAVDLLHALLSPDLHRMLTRERGWSDDRYETWLRATLRSQLLAGLPA
jgi:AcrR family transcriptional regulator